MLDSLFIDNFRLFRKLKIEELGQVNLIVGENNSGKSALLEGLQVYASNAQAKNLFDLVFSRKESWKKEDSFHGNEIENNPIRHLFYDHELPKVNRDGFRIGESSKSKENIHVRVGAYKSEEKEDGSVVSKRVNKINKEDEISDYEFSLISEQNGKSKKIFDLEEDISSPRFRRKHMSRGRGEKKYPFQVVPTDSISSRKVASLWDSTSLTDLEEDVISCLNIIDERIDRIAFVEESRSRGRGDERIPIVKIEGRKDPLPLKSMGDGMTRLFHITLSLVNTQNGILLVDEFENGIHWSIHPKLWRSVFRISKRLNVQVFATTHSRDCIEGFDNAWNEFEDAGAFFRLNRKNFEYSGVTAYNSETLTDALEMDVEVR